MEKLNYVECPSCENRIFHIEENNKCGSCGFVLETEQSE